MTTIAAALAPTEEAAAENPDIRYAQFHHNNFLTRRLEEMKAWYATVLGMTTVFEWPMAIWMTNDRANHRLALTRPPHLGEDTNKREHARLHHQAFEYPSFDDLNATYLRLRTEGIRPQVCMDHGMTFSYYYCDPDGNLLELQCDNFGDWAASTEWMRTSPQFAANPMGACVDPDKVAQGYADGLPFEEIRRRVWETDDFRSAEPPDLGGPLPQPGDPPMPLKW